MSSGRSVNKSRTVARQMSTEGNEVTVSQRDAKRCETANPVEAFVARSFEGTAEIVFKFRHQREKSPASTALS